MEGGRDALCARLEWQVSHVNYIAIERVCDGSDVEVREALQKHVLVERGRVGGMMSLIAPKWGVSETCNAPVQRIARLTLRQMRNLLSHQ